MDSTKFSNLQLMRDAYQKIYGYEPASDLATEKLQILIELAEEYQLSTASQQMNHTGIRWMEKPVNKAKVIALEAAIKTLSAEDDTDFLIDIAERVYQWLIKKEENG